MSESNSDLIVEMLKDAGVTHGFGIPSGNVIPFMDAMRRGGIEFVLTAHEGSAGFAADVMGRLTGSPGFCISTLGPGATNLTTGVGDAYLDRSPLIALTCDLPANQIGRRIQMYIDHHGLFRPITKGTFPLREGNVATTVETAIRLAMSDPYGPVHLDLPEDVSLAPAGGSAPSAPGGEKMKPAPDAAVERLGEILRAAKRPVAVLGLTALRSKNPEKLKAFIENHQLPFATTTMAKGMIDEDHPLSIGCIERSRRQVQRAFLRGADLIVGLGYDTIEVEFEQWIGPVPLVNVDIEPADTDGSVQIAHEVIGDFDASLDRMVRLAPGENEWAAEAALRQKEKFQKSLRPAAEGFPVHQAIDAVREALPREGILTFDVGAHTHQIASQWTAHAPRTFLITNGWSSMGFGLPAAIGAKLARPDLPVVAMVGDGCFQMTCGELVTAKRLGIALPVVVLDDSWLSLIQVKQERQSLPFYGTALSSAGHPGPPAHYFGVPAVGVRGPGELDRELRKAMAAEGPTVIEAIVNAEHYMETVYD